MADVNTIVNAFGTKLVTDLRNKLRDKGVTFNGGADSRLAAQTKYVVTFNPGGFEFDLLMPKEWYWVNSGRNPGNVSKEARKDIEKWAVKKGIVGKFITDNLKDRIDSQHESKAKLSHSKRSYKVLKPLSFKKGVEALGYLVSRKITMKGYKPTHFYDEVINDGRLAKFQKELSAAYKQQIIIDIRNSI